MDVKNFTEKVALPCRPADPTLPSLVFCECMIRTLNPLKRIFKELSRCGSQRAPNTFKGLETFSSRASANSLNSRRAYDLHHRRIAAWNQAILNPLALQQYADAVSDKGAALNNCFGFVDGTVRPICRPGENQRMLYNGHKRVHALKFQAVALPNGLIGQLFGPVGKN